MGDLRTLGALRTIDATGKTVVPLVDDKLTEGQMVDLPEWRTKVGDQHQRRAAGALRAAQAGARSRASIRWS